MPEEKKYIDLQDFLRKHKTIPEKKFTHTALGHPPDSYPGSYCIEDEDLTLFHNLYNKFVFENSNVIKIAFECKYMLKILNSIGIGLKGNELNGLNEFNQWICVDQ